jgi:plasmid stabilization system protein ParE
LAYAEIREAANWYRQHGEHLHRDFLAAVRSALADVEVEPLRYGKLETLSPNTPFRRILVRRFPYLIVYRVFENDVFVYAIAHTSRRPNYWRRRKRDP